jgi:hypothetical protein
VHRAARVLHAFGHVFLYLVCAVQAQRAHAQTVLRELAGPVEQAFGQRLLDIGHCRQVVAHVGHRVGSQRFGKLDHLSRVARRDWSVPGHSGRGHVGGVFVVVGRLIRAVRSCADARGQQQEQRDGNRFHELFLCAGGERRQVVATKWMARTSATAARRKLSQTPKLLQ